MKNIPIEEWGKDHWSLLLYVETRCVDYNGTLDFSHLRDKLGRGTRPMGYKWSNYEDGTRLKGYFLPDGTKDKSRQLKDHDDLDCLDDLEFAGLVENVGTGMNPLITMKDKGYDFIRDLRKHKADGGQCSTFEPKL